MASARTRPPPGAAEMVSSWPWNSPAAGDRGASSGRLTPALGNPNPRFSAGIPAGTENPASGTRAGRGPGQLRPINGDIPRGSSASAAHPLCRNGLSMADSFGASSAGFLTGAAGGVSSGDSAGVSIGVSTGGSTGGFGGVSVGDSPGTSIGGSGRKGVPGVGRCPFSNGGTPLPPGVCPGANLALEGGNCLSPSGVGSTSAPIAWGNSTSGRDSPGHCRHLTGK